MIARSVYILQSQIIGLEAVPFAISKDRTIHSAFRPIFRSPNCFTDMRLSITDADREFDVPLPDKPFLRSLGQVVFNTRSARFSNSFHRTVLAELLGRQKNYWDPTGKPEQLSDIDYKVEEYELNVFGYDHTLEDQRMNHLYFELRRPFFLQASFEGKVVADGRVYIHIYPSGYLIIHLAVSLKEILLKDWTNLRIAIKETRPWRSYNVWTWSSKWGSGMLKQVIGEIKYTVTRSIRSDGLPHNTKSPWYTAMKIVTDIEPHHVSEGLLLHKQNTLEFGTYVNSYVNGYSRDIIERSYKKNLVTTDQGIICIMPTTHNRRSALRIFSKIHLLYEFVALKKRILEDYATYLRLEITTLREYRLSTTRKFYKEDIRRLSVFDPRIPRYLLALDNHILNASPYFRRVYSFMSQEMGFDDLRKTVLKQVEEWEAEVEHWDHSIVVLWKKVVSPLRSLLGGG